MTVDSRPHLLYLVHRFPYPPDKGDRIRAYQIIKYLSPRTHLHLACLADEPVEDSARTHLDALCCRLEVVPLGGWTRWLRAFGSLALGRTVTQGAFSSSALRNLLHRWSQDTSFQGILASSSSMVPYLRLPELRNIPAVVDLVDVDSQKWLDYAGVVRGPKQWLYRLESRRLRRLETELPSWARAVTLVSQPEVDLYRTFSAPGAIQAITNGVDLDYFQPQPEVREEGCVFVGALDYWPNVEGMTWFCRKVWPGILRAQQAARMVLVGRRPTPEVCSLAKITGVQVVGQVFDVRPFVAGSAVVVVPLNIARGVQNKVLEALAMGKAVLVSPQALQGLDLVPDRHLLTAASPAEWTKNVLWLLDNPVRRKQLGQAGRQFVLDHHCWDRCLEPLDGLIFRSKNPQSQMVSVS